MDPTKWKASILPNGLRAGRLQCAGWSRHALVPVEERTPAFYAEHVIMRYLVKARVKPGQEERLLRAIDQQTLGKGSIAGDEYQYDMKQARVDPAGVATWVETCFCDPPLEEERPYWEKHFELLAIKDAHSRRNCRHENGAEPWACCDCDCTQKLEEKLQGQGESFLAKLRSSTSSS